MTFSEKTTKRWMSVQPRNQNKGWDGTSPPLAAADHSLLLLSVTLREWAWACTCFPWNCKAWGCCFWPQLSRFYACTLHLATLVWSCLKQNVVVDGELVDFEMDMESLTNMALGSLVSPSTSSCRIPSKEWRLKMKMKNSTQLLSASFPTSPLWMIWIWTCTQWHGDAHQWQEGHLVALHSALTRRHTLWVHQEQELQNVFEEFYLQESHAWHHTFVYG